jgi:hypothetical protein
MKVLAAVLIEITLLCPFSVCAQNVTLSKDNLEAVSVAMAIETMDQKTVVKVSKDPAMTTADEPTFVKIKGAEFKDGTIEVKVLSRLLPTAPETARGFIGVVFRATPDNSKFECIYIRPTNGRASDQVRRNHSIQYFSYPDYKFDRLRKEAPERYESYADMGLNEWIKMKIVVKGVQARLFLNDNKEPSLIVSDLKHGADLSGGIGLYVDNGTEGYFADITISK